MSTLRVIFVCSGNICRSPMAEAMAREMFAERDISAVAISMGTLGIEGRPASVEAKKALAEVDIELDSHRSQGVSPGLVEVADWLVVMAPRHERTLRSLGDDIGDRIVRIWEYVDADIDGIPDPVGQNIEVFRNIRTRLEEGLNNWIAELDPPEDTT